MTTLENFVSPALTRALGWTLLHSLWQGALVAAILAGALLLLRRQRAEVRYVASAGALGMVVALAGITFGLCFTAGAGQGVLLSPAVLPATQVLPLRQAETPTATVSTTAAGRMMPAITAVTAKNRPVAVVAGNRLETQAVANPLNQALMAGLRYFDNHLPLLVVGWLLGLLAMSLRMLGGLLYVQRLKRYRVRPLPAVWQERLAALAARSGIRRPVALLESALVQVPLVVGHLRPVILLPLGTVAGLSPAYLEAILAHELAHVLRRDYLVNLLQTVAEVLFFYHPAVWFMANCVRTERENCCDDAATALVGGDPLRLARALTALAEWSQSAVVPAAPRLALAAIGGRGALLNRVRRLVQRRPAAPTLAEGIMAGALVLGGLGLLGGSVALAGPLAQPTMPEKKPAAFDWQTGPVQTAPKPASPADTTKRVAGTTTTTAAPLVPPVSSVPGQPGDMSRETPAAPDAPGADTQEPHGDDQPAQDPPGRKRRNRRASPTGFAFDTRPFPGQPGTVVITKDKKGRLTDLVVNGQHVDTETGQGKLKIKDKGKDGQDQQVQIIQVVPQGFPEARAFVYRSDASAARQLERLAQRDAERSFKNFNYQFQFPQLEKQQAEKLYADARQQVFNKDFNANFNGQLNRNFRVRTPFSNGPSLDAQRDALRAAERALREAGAVKSLSTEQRKRIGRELEKVQAERKQLETASSTKRLRLNGADNRLADEQFRKRSEELRNRAEELRDRQQELQERIRESQQELQDLEQGGVRQDREQATRDREQATRDREQVIRDREQVARDREQATRDRERAGRDRERATRDRERTDALVDQLLKDGLIKDKDNFQLKLTSSTLTVNGKQQPPKVFQKYLKLYESSTGRKMSATGAMVITRNGNSSSISSGDAPTPPRPPRAPLPPLAAPMAPMAPLAPPAPPKPPRVDSETLRDELRKDSLIGANDKSFQFQLNDAGLTVNGKKQSDDLAAKYRKLTGHEGGKNFNVTMSFEE